MFPKFVLISRVDNPRTGTFVNGMVFQHQELVEEYQKIHGYVKVHGGGWYDRDDEKRTITLYGGSGDYGEPRFSFLDRIPRELRGYKFFYTPIHGLPGNELDLTDVEWF